MTKELQKNDFQSTKLINGKSAPKTEFGSQLLCLGVGNSAYLFASLVDETTPVLVLTENEVGSNKVQSQWRVERNNFNQTELGSNYGEAARNFIRDGIKNAKTTTIVVTTNPQRGKFWMDHLLSDKDFTMILKSNPDQIQLILPQVPNPHLEDFKKIGCPVVELEYSQIIDVKHGNNKTAEIAAEIKKNPNFVVSNYEKLSGDQKTHLNNIVQHLCANQEINTKEEKTPATILQPISVDKAQNQDKQISRL